MQHNIIVTLINDLQNHKSNTVSPSPLSSLQPANGFPLQKQATHLQNVLIITKQNAQAHGIASIVMQAVS